VIDELVRRKTARASAASLPNYETILDRSSAFSDLKPIGNAFTRSVFDGDFYVSASRDPASPAVNLVFVQSKDGNTGAPNPGSLGGGDVDLHLIYEGLSRVAADGVLAGSTTMRGSKTILSVWHPELVALRHDLGLPRHPAQIIVTAERFEVDRELVTNVPELPAFIITTLEGRERIESEVVKRPWITVVVMSEGGGFAEALQVLAEEHGLRTISCIGGAKTATALLDLQAVRDIYLTTSAREGGEPGTPFYRGLTPPSYELVLKKAGTGPESGVVFEHLRVAATSRTGS
jgi:riboflavin biosynthesis pyrimidine reductase